MKSLRLALIVGIAAVVIGVVAVLIGRMGQGSDTWESHYPRSSVSLAPGVATPQEIDVVATPQADGTLDVAQTLVFEATGQTQDVIVMVNSYRRFGWISDDRPAQYWFTPRVVEVTAAEQTSGSSVSLKVTRDDRDYEPDSRGTYYLVGKGQQWKPGRHVLEMSFTLSNVWFDIDGDEVMVLPLDFFQSNQQGRLDSTIVRIPDQEITCPADNVTWDPDARCTGSNGDRWSSYRESQGMSHNVLAVVNPDGITADPAPSPTRKRGG